MTNRARTASAAVLAALLCIGTVSGRSASALDGPRVSLGDQSGLERDEVTGSVFVPVTLSKAADEPVVVSFYTVDGTATANQDYARWGTPASPRTVTIPAGVLQGTINVPVLADDEVEPDETFSVVIAGVSGAGATIGRATGTATIVDSDVLAGPNPVINVSSPTIHEGDEGARRAQFLVHLSRAPASNVTISYATVDGTAVADQDYVAKLPGTVVFAPGQISKTIDVLVGSDSFLGPDRQFTLAVSVIGGSPVEELQMSGVATILDDDEGAPSPPVISSWTVASGTGPAPATVALSWSVSDPAGGSLTCRIDGTDDGTFDVVVNFCPASGSRNVSVPTAGTVQARLRVESSSGAFAERTVPVSTSADPVETYQVQLRGLETLTPARAAAFTAAKTRLESIIVRGVPDIAVPPRPSCLHATSPDLPPLIDDVLIDVTIEPIDGVGGVLGSAGPSCVRSTSFLPAVGRMTFDEADVDALIADGRFEVVVLHEMIHVLGLGTVWNLLSLLDGGGTEDPVFTGARGIAEWQALGGSGDVPVENTGGPGTRDGHWRKTVFGDELMTGYLGLGTNPLSRLSIASLADLGYQVDLDTADSYELPGLFARMGVSADLWELEMLRPEIGTL